MTLAAPLTHKHLGEAVPLAGGLSLQARAEVAVLTRNVVVRGSDNIEWHDKIEACPDGFDTGKLLRLISSLIAFY